MTTKPRNVSLFEDQRMGFKDAIEMALDNLRAYGAKYKHWAVAYSGGKDSSATTSLIAWALRYQLIDPPESVTVLYADTRQELPPLHATAMQFMGALEEHGIQTRVVLPKLDKRFYVYMLGRGVPPPNNSTLRWCTGALKIDPMNAALDDISASLYPVPPHARSLIAQAQYQLLKQGDWQRAMFLEANKPPRDKFLMMKGVRLGESAARDARIAVSCSTDKGECGQGWFEPSAKNAISDTLSPIIHFRLCYVWDWLYFANNDRYMRNMGYPGGHGFDMLGNIAVVYGDDEARTGCVGCALAQNETALENCISFPEWAHLKPLLRIKPLLRELREPQHRLRKAAPEKLKSGKLSKSGQRMGPLTFEAREWALEQVLAIQAEAGVDLINAVELARIRELIAAKTWPNRWTGDEPLATVPLDQIAVVDGKLTGTRLLL